jgi:hypothetical protein
MDLSKLSTDDLIALRNGDLSAVSDDGLRTLKGERRPDSIGRQTGLFARSAVKAAAAIPGMGADALGGLYNTAADALSGGGDGFRFKETLPTIDALLTQVGLPQPETSQERIVGQGVEMGLGAGGAASLASKASTSVASPLAKNVLSRVGADPALQAVAGAGGGAAGQQSKESGGGWLDQLVSTLVGGGGAAGLMSGGRALAGKASSLMPSQQITATLDQRIDRVMQGRGIDPTTVTPAMRRSLRDELAKAMKLGDVSDDALARLADYKRLGLEPTRRRLTLDPFDVTQELNAEKTAAATGARDARLPAIAQDNNKRLIAEIERFSPLSDRQGVGERAMAPILRADAQLKANERALYDQARDMAGGDIPLSRAPLNAIYERLTKERKIRFVPQEVMGTIDDILNDTNAPFDVNTVDALKSVIATASRGTKDGNVKAALKIVRDTLDDMPMEPVKRDFGGSQLVTQATAEKLTAADRAAADLMEQLNKARRAAFTRREWQRSAPLIENTLDDADPSKFVQTIIGRNAAPKDVARAAGLINRDPEARAAVRSGIAQYLKDQAIGKGNDAATGNFSGRQMASALDNIGADKLKLFFDADEVEQLRAIARVGTIETFQPRGSAVNNSNTAAGVAGLLQGLTKYIKPVANKLPLGQEIVSNPINSLTLSLMQRRAMNTPQGLLAPTVGPEASTMDKAILPALTGMGLLAP